VASGDIARARMLADTMELLGRGLQVTYGRDLHQYTRGLLHVHQSDADRAATAAQGQGMAGHLGRANEGGVGAGAGSNPALPDPR
jgi:hypothetical protein